MIVRASAARLVDLIISFVVEYMLITPAGWISAGIELYSTTVIQPISFVTFIYFYGNIFDDELL